MSEEEYNRLLKQFPEKLKGVLSWKKYFERLVQAGRRTGRSDIQIGDDIRKELKGQLDDRTIRNYLPNSMKHMEHAREPDQRSGYTKQVANNNKEIEIPPAPVIIHGETIQDAEHMVFRRKADLPKEFVGSNDPDYELILDCNKFRTELRKTSSKK